MRNRRALIIDDTESIHRDFEKVLAPKRAATNGLADLEADLFGPSEAEPAAKGDDVVFELAFARQGLDGIALAQKALDEGSPFAAAFVDVRMPPGLDGIETIARLWQVDPRLEIVICTAYSDYTWAQMLERLARAEQFLVLNKPFEGTAVKQLALGLTEKWNLARAAERTTAALEAVVNERTLQLRQEMERRSEVERRLRHAQRLEALGRLVAGVAHEVNNPLSFVLSNLDHLKLELDDLAQTIGGRAHDLSSAADDARSGGRRIQQIVKDLKSFAKSDPQVQEQVDVERSFEFALRMARFSFPPDLAVDTRFEPGLPALNANSGQLSQVFINLVVNAAQAMTSVPEARRKLEVTARPLEGDRVQIEITDQGVGIRSEDLPRVFDPFFSSKGLGGGGGTGLGLSICHGIVQALGGEISLRSQLGVGTTATMILPVNRPWRSEPSVQPVKSTPSQLAAS